MIRQRIIGNIDEIMSNLTDAERENLKIPQKRWSDNSSKPLDELLTFNMPTLRIKKLSDASAINRINQP